MSLIRQLKVFTFSRTIPVNVPLHFVNRQREKYDGMDIIFKEFLSVFLYQDREALLET